MAVKEVSDCVSILSEITIYNKYAKYLPLIGRRETWRELVGRNMTMHIKMYPSLEGKIREVYKEFVLPKKVLPSMRSLQFGGTPIDNSHNKIFNCAYLPADHVDSFSEMMFLLLGGTGGGYSVQKRHVNKLPAIKARRGNRRFLVSDTIEGWADTIKVVVESYFYGKHEPKFNFKDVRPKGAALITSGGKAPGPEPLKNCVIQLTELFDEAVGNKLTTVQVHDAMCIIADAVLAGGIRRAALICLFDRDDEAMLLCKSAHKFYAKGSIKLMEGLYQIYGYYLDTHGEIRIREFYRDTPAVGEIDVQWWEVEPQRGRANNSAMLPRGKVGKEEFKALWKKVENSGSGEPGIYWTNDLDWGTNPCCEISLKPFQFCNLIDVNASDIESQKDLNDRARAGAFIATLQAGYTDFHYLRPIWRETTESEALIGVGLTGIGSGRLVGLNLKLAAEVVIAENAATAKLIGISSAARTTTVKPAGSTSLVVGSSSGIHAWHNDYYIRRMRVGKDEALYTYVRDNIPELLEDDVMNPKGAIFCFPQKAPVGAMLRTESYRTLLERVKQVNTQWVHSGHVSGINTHNVSCTISLRDDEWWDCGEWMWENKEFYNGISVLNYDGGSYIQAPFEDCSKETYEEMVTHLKAVDLTQVREEDDNTDLKGEAACAGGACEVI